VQQVLPSFRQNPPYPRPLTCIAGEQRVARHMLSPQATVLATQDPPTRVIVLLWRELQALGVGGRMLRAVQLL